MRDGYYWLVRLALVGLAIVVVLGALLGLLVVMPLFSAMVLAALGCATISYWLFKLA